MSTAVVILGFFGSTAKNLERVAQMYQALMPDAQVLAFPAPEFTPTPWSTRAIEERLRECAPARVIVHLFSNRGAMQYIWLALGGALRGRRLAGVVLDSSPGSLSMLSAVRAVAANSRDHRFRFALFTVPAVALLALAIRRGGLMSVLARLAIASVASEALSIPLLRFFTTWDPTRAPTLFLFSEEDALIPASGIRDVAALRSRDIGRVATHQFFGSAHVRHQLCFPDEYARVVGDFCKQML